MMMALFWPAALLLVASLVLMVTILNFDFYRFFAKRSGVWFAIRVFPLHWLYFWYCGFSFAWGALAHYIDNTVSTPQSMPKAG
jgi:hypothetical protein